MKNFSYRTQNTCYKTRVPTSQILFIEYKKFNHDQK